MTKAVFNFGDYGIESFEINGHSGYSESGSDIVCSGISTAVFTSFNLLDKLYPESINFFQDENKGYMKCIINFDHCQDLKTLNLIVQNLIDVLKNIEGDYPKNCKVIINSKIKN